MLMFSQFYFVAHFGDSYKTKADVRMRVSDLVVLLNVMNDRFDRKCCKRLVFAQS